MNCGKCEATRALKSIQLTLFEVSNFSKQARFFGSLIRDTRLKFSTVNTSLSSSASTFSRTSNNSGNVVKLIHSYNKSFNNLSNIARSFGV